MKAPAWLALIVYAAGIPLAFFILLARNRAAIKEDQTLKLQGLGNSSATNPNFHVRRRLQKLYSLFEPRMYWWRLALVRGRRQDAGLALRCLRGLCGGRKEWVGAGPGRQAGFEGHE
jgi:hypothetical protein